MKKPSLFGEEIMLPIKNKKSNITTILMPSLSSLFIKYANHKEEKYAKYFESEQPHNRLIFNSCIKGINEHYPIITNSKLIDIDSSSW